MVILTGYRISLGSLESRQTADNFVFCKSRVRILSGQFLNSSGTVLLPRLLSNSNNLRLGLLYVAMESEGMNEALSR